MARTRASDAATLSRNPRRYLFLADGLSGEEAERLRQHERTGRPLGSERNLKRLEQRLSRVFRKQSPAPKKDN